MIELAGWIGSACFALCGLPMVVKIVKDGHADGLSWMFLALWGLGEVFCSIYALGHQATPLLFNYAFNGACIAVALWYKVNKRGNQ